MKEESLDNFRSYFSKCVSFSWCFIFWADQLRNLIYEALFVVTDDFIFNQLHSEQLATAAANMTTSSNVPEINAAEVSPSDGISDGTAAYLDAADDDLEGELMSDFSKLQINSSDCPRTFSPIGSERTSPEQG